MPFILPKNRCENHRERASGKTLRLQGLRRWYRRT